MPTDENQKLPPMVNLAQYSIEQLLLDAASSRRPDRHSLADPGHRDRGVSDGARLDAGDAAAATTARRRLGGRCRWRPQHPARGAGPAAEGHELRRPLRHRRHPARSQRPTERLAYSTRLQPRLDGAGAQAAGRRLAHRLPAARRRRPRRGDHAGERDAARREPARHDGRDAPSGSRSGWASTRPTR